MFSRKRTLPLDEPSMKDTQICEWIEEGNIDCVSRCKKCLREVRTKCGSNLLVVAPHIDIAEWLVQQGVETDDPYGDLLCNSYQEVARWLTQKSISILPALEKVERLQEAPLSPTTQKGLYQRKQELLQCKRETNQILISIMIDQTPLIKDIAKVIVQYL